MARQSWFREWFRSEEANTFALLVTMLPMLMTAFGLGVDMTHNQYVRQELQASADQATVAATGATVTGADKVSRIVSDAEAFTILRRVYSANRDLGPARMNCIGTTYCWAEPSPPAIVSGRRVLVFTVHEQSRNGFLAGFGIPTQDYHLISRARVNQSTE